MKNEHIVIVNKALCIKCGLCVKDCPSGALAIEKGGAEATDAQCLQCGHCVAICPQNAIAITGFEDEPEAITPEMRADASALLGQLKARRSMRHFTSQPIAPEVIEQVIQAGRYTPSGSNRQAVSYVVLRENIAQYERIALSLFRRAKKLADLFSSQFRQIEIDDHFLFKNAPVVIVIKSPSMVDGALAASSMELMAQALGLGALYSGFFTLTIKLSRKLKKKLSMAPGEKVVTTLVLGYPGVKYQRIAPKERPTVIYD